MRVQYYKFEDRLYVEDGPAVYKQPAMVVNDKKAYVFTATSDVFNKRSYGHWKKAKEISKDELTPDHFCEQTLEERFEIRKAQLLKMGFVDNNPDFSLKGIWSCYWEQVYSPSDEKWEEYLLAIEEAHNSHYAKKD